MPKKLLAELHEVHYVLSLTIKPMRRSMIPVIRKAIVLLSARYSIAKNVPASAKKMSAARSMHALTSSLTT